MPLRSAEISQTARTSKNETKFHFREEELNFISRLNVFKIGNCRSCKLTDSQRNSRSSHQSSSHHLLVKVKN